MFSVFIYKFDVTGIFILKSLYLVYDDGMSI